MGERRTGRDAPGTGVRPEHVVWVFLVVVVGSVFVAVLPGLAWRGGAAGLALGAVLAPVAAALAVVLWLATAPSAGRRTEWWALGALLAATAAAWAPVSLAAVDDRHPWAWLAGAAAAACALVHRVAGLVAAGVLAAAAALGAVVFGGGTLAAVVVTLGCALGVWLTGEIAVWLLRLLAAAHAGGDARAELAVARERLRVARELHDVLGHRLGVIALEAELAEALVRTDPARAEQAGSTIREMAASTLAEARRAVYQDTAGDLRDRIDAARAVLASAGTGVTVVAEPALLDRMPQRVSALLAAVLREAVTNVVRHSDARHVTIRVGGGADAPSLTVADDGGQVDAEHSGGTGLGALAARCAEVGMHLAAGRATSGGFEVHVSPARKEEE